MASETSPSSPPVETINVDRPFLGLWSFGEQTSRFFFGREDEIADLCGRIGNNPLTVLYGQSGLGKTSLLGAGVIPRLREPVARRKSDAPAQPAYQPALCRLDYSDGAPSLIEQTKSAFIALLPDHSRAAVGSVKTLWEMFHLLPQAVGDDDPVPVLIFDQFEEIFTLGQTPAFKEQAREWITQVSDLVQGRPPQHLEERLNTDLSLAACYAQSNPMAARIVISLREDYLSHLEGWRDQMPRLMQNRMALHRLRGTQALDAVIGPASMGDDMLVHPAVATDIIRIVADVEKSVPLSEIEAVPPILSLVCEQLNESRIKAGEKSIRADLVAEESDKILQRFYEESYAELAPDVRDAVRNCVESALLTQSGYRKSEVREDLVATLAHSGVAAAAAEKALDHLQNRRLLVSDERSGLPRLEFSHDVLAPIVKASRDERQEQERLVEAKRQQEKAETALRKAEQKAAAERRKRAVLSLLLLGAAVCLAAAIFLGLKAKRAGEIARDNEALALAATEKANEQRDAATASRARVVDLLKGAAQISFDNATRSLAESQPSQGVSLLSRAIQLADDATHPASQRRLLSELSRGDHPVDISRYSADIIGIQPRRDGKAMVVALANGRAVYQPLALSADGDDSQTIEIRGLDSIFPIPHTDLIGAVYRAVDNDGASRSAHHFAILPTPREDPADDAITDLLVQLTTPNVFRNVQVSADGFTAVAYDSANTIHFLTAYPEQRRDPNIPAQFTYSASLGILDLQMIEKDVVVLFEGDNGSQLIERWSLNWFGETPEAVWSIDILDPDSGLNAQQITEFSVSKSGEEIAILDVQGAVTLFDASSGSVRNRFSPLSRPDRIVIAGDSNHLIAISEDASKTVIESFDADYGGINWAATLEGLLAESNDATLPRNFAVSPDALSIATGTERGELRITDLTSGAPILRTHTSSPILQLGFSADSSQIFVACADRSVRRYDLTLNPLTWRKVRDNEASAQHFHSAALHRHITINDGQLRVVDSQSGETLRTEKLTRTVQSAVICDATQTFYYAADDGKILALPLSGDGEMTELAILSAETMATQQLHVSARGNALLCELPGRKLVVYRLEDSEFHTHRYEGELLDVSSPTDSDDFWISTSSPADDKTQLSIAALDLDGGNTPTFLHIEDSTIRSIILTSDTRNALINTTAGELVWFPIEPIDLSKGADSSAVEMQATPSTNATREEADGLNATRETKKNAESSNRRVISRGELFRHLQLSSDDQHLAALTDQGIINVFDLSSDSQGKRSFPIVAKVASSADANLIAFSPESRLMAYPSAINFSVPDEMRPLENHVSILDLAQAAEVERLPITNKATFLHFSGEHSLNVVTRTNWSQLQLAPATSSFHLEGQQEDPVLVPLVEITSGIISSTDRTQSPASASDLSIQKRTTARILEQNPDASDIRRRALWRHTSAADRSHLGSGDSLRTLAGKSFQTLAQPNHGLSPVEALAICQTHSWHPCAPAARILLFQKVEDFSDFDRTLACEDVQRRFAQIDISDWGEEQFRTDLESAAAFMKQLRKGNLAEDFRTAMIARLDAVTTDE